MELTINDQVVTAHDGESILRCALRHDIFIPHLCTHPSLPDFGACRMCLVEVTGLRGRAAACTTPAAEGMVVQTNTPALKQLRKGILELLLLEHPSACIVCDEQALCDEYRQQPQKAGRTTGCHTCNNKDDCELRDLAKELGINHLPVPTFYRDLSIERWDPFIDRDLNLCILCGRCVRICREQHGTATIDFTGRGSRVRISEAFGRTLEEAGCHFCGSCVDVCPTGSIAERYAKWLRRPDRSEETTCRFCPAACPLRVEVKQDRAVSAHSALPETAICLLGRFCIPAFQNHPERLRVPRIRVGSVLREVSWEEAFADAAKKLSGQTGDAFAFLCDTISCTREDRFVFKRFTNEVMKSKHYIEITPDERGRCNALLPPGIKALYSTGPYLTTDECTDLDLLVVQDCHPSDLSESATFVFPATILAETGGSCLDDEGTPRPLSPVSPPPGIARADWEIVVGLTEAIGAKAPVFSSAAEITALLPDGGSADSNQLRRKRDSLPAPVIDPALRHTHYRGHEIAKTVTGLKSLPLGDDKPAPNTAGEDKDVQDPVKT